MFLKFNFTIKNTWYGNLMLILIFHRALIFNPILLCQHHHDPQVGACCQPCISFNIYKELLKSYLAGVLNLLNEGHVSYYKSSTELRNPREWLYEESMGSPRKIIHYLYGFVIDGLKFANLQSWDPVKWLLKMLFSWTFVAGWAKKNSWLRELFLLVSSDIQHV